MKKIAFTVFILLFSGCSIDQRVLAPDALPPKHYHSAEILGYMEMNETTNPTLYKEMQTFFDNAEDPCFWKDFIEYRQCFVLGIEKQESLPPISEALKDHLALVVKSLRDEATFIGDYQKLDQTSMPKEDPNGSGSGCLVVASIHRDLKDPLRYVSPWTVALSYSENIGSIENIFPSWKKRADLLTKKPIKDKLLHDNSCAHWTFGPDPGNVLYFLDTKERVYLFIKNADGGWSGDFSYAVFSYDKYTHVFTNIGYFDNRAGIIPFYAYTMKEKTDELVRSRHLILETFKNKPFLYRGYLDNQRMGTVSAIQELLENSLLEP